MNTRQRNDHHYTLDLSTGSYAVPASAFAKQLTLERWIEAISSGSRSAGTAELIDRTLLEEELIGAL